MRKLWSAIALITSVPGSIYGSVATPTEAAGVGAFGALGVALLYRSLNFKKLIEIARRTVELTGFMKRQIRTVIFSFQPKTGNPCLPIPSTARMSVDRKEALSLL